jgi:selenocysteine lyase/cysteine desulfurase
VVTAASNVTGELWPVAELARVARRHGARIAVDVAQLVPHRPVSLTELDVDYLAFSGHKLYAPYAIGVRDGRFCAHLLLDRLAGRGGTAVRASIGLGPVDEHIDRLLSALAVLCGRHATAAPAPSIGSGIHRLPRSVVPV